MDNKNSKDDIENNLPKSFYKYYSIDKGVSRSDSNKNCKCSECKSCIMGREKRIKDRLNGQVYFSSPLAFNDLIDSQLKSKNNFEMMDSDKLRLKLYELYYKNEKLLLEIESKGEELKSGKCSTELLSEVQKKQLENTGILCLTRSNTNANMWGYYANNDGFCVEYSTKNLMYDITLDFAVNMDEKLINLLIEKNYCLKDRDIETLPQRTKFAQEIFNNKWEIDKVLNKNLTFKQLTDEDKQFFIQNLYIKRLWGRDVEYKKRKEIESILPTIIEDKSESKVVGKYFYKEKFWEHENEYRFILSLGGSKAINLRKETVKSITFGAKTSRETIDKYKQDIGKEVVIKQIIIGPNNNLIASEI